MKTRLTRRALLLAAAVLAASARAGVAFATIPSSGGVINGCFDQQSGLLRVIDADAGGKCRNAETAISWNEQGPGDPGPPGATERQASGAHGVTPGRRENGASLENRARRVSEADRRHRRPGAEGRHGQPGSAGERGLQGEQGPKGDTGSPGAQASAASKASRGEGRHGQPGSAGQARPPRRAGAEGGHGQPGSAGRRRAAGPAGPARAAGRAGPSRRRRAGGVGGLGSRSSRVGLRRRNRGAWMGAAGRLVDERRAHAGCFELRNHRRAARRGSRARSGSGSARQHNRILITTYESSGPPGSLVATPAERLLDGHLLLNDGVRRRRACPGHYASGMRPRRARCQRFAHGLSSIRSSVPGRSRGR